MLTLIAMVKGILKVDGRRIQFGMGSCFADDLINIPEDVVLSTRSSQRLASGI